MLLRMVKANNLTHPLYYLQSYLHTLQSHQDFVKSGGNFVNNVKDVSGMIYCRQVEDYNITQSIYVSLGSTSQICRANQHAPIRILEDLILVI